MPDEQATADETAAEESKKKPRVRKTPPPKPAKVESDPAEIESAEDLRLRKEIARMIGGKIRVLMADDDGRTVAGDRKITAEDILAYALRGDVMTAVTVDGRKHELRK